uniref:Metallophos domain-containing protein n=1 Tax=Mesocestoides corti TaxID=53468 RepID=A0A5K3FB79_MESCO
MKEGLVCVEGHCLPYNLDDQCSDYTFVQLADPQLGLLERYIEKRDPPFHWDRELALVDRAVSAINKISPRPKFVFICGDLVDAEPGNCDRRHQITDLKSSLHNLSSGLPVFVLPGNHDIGNSPCMADIEDYKSHWGDDYYTFWCGDVKYLVINSQLYWDCKNCQSAAAAQNAWLNAELSAEENAGAKQLVVFQHIPPFIKSADEDGGYFNLSKETRMDLLSKYYQAGVRLVFSGHLHYNGGGPWCPTADASGAPLEVVSSSAVGVQLGSDKPGLRLVRVSSTGISHKYFTFDELENDPTITNSKF